MSFQEETARIVAAHIAGEHGVISLNLSKETRSKPPSELKSYEAILRVLRIRSEPRPETLIGSIESLESAVQDRGRLLIRSVQCSAACTTRDYV